MGRLGEFLRSETRARYGRLGACGLSPLGSRRREPDLDGLVDQGTCWCSWARRCDVRSQPGELEGLASVLAEPLDKSGIPHRVARFLCNVPVSCET